MKYIQLTKTSTSFTFEPDLLKNRDMDQNSLLYPHRCLLHMISLLQLWNSQSKSGRENIQTMVSPFGSKLLRLFYVAIPENKYSNQITLQTSTSSKGVPICLAISHTLYAVLLLKCRVLHALASYSNNTQRIFQHCLLPPCAWIFAALKEGSMN